MACEFPFGINKVKQIKSNLIYNIINVESYSLLYNTHLMFTDINDIYSCKYYYFYYLILIE